MIDWKNSLVRAQQGDLAAFDAVVKQFQGMAVGYAYSILHDFQLAEDAAQEAFIQAYMDREMLREPQAFPAWLRKLVFKQCDRITRKKRVSTTPLDDNVDLHIASPTLLETVERQETQKVVLSAVDTLPEDQRIATMLYYIDGYSLSEVGEFLDVPAHTIKSRLHCARAKLRNKMIGLVEETLKQNAPGENFHNRIRKILEGIAQFPWESTWFCFEGSLYGCLKYIDKEINLAYLMGVSGGAFKFFWHPDSSPAMCDLSLLGEEPIKRICKALGYSYTYDEDRYTICHKNGDLGGLQKDPSHTEEYYTQRIVKSIDAGRPVLARGILPVPIFDDKVFLEYCVITGYNEGGKVLYGASYFQAMLQQSGYFRVEDWYDKCFGVITLGQRCKPQTPLEIVTDAVAWAIDLARTPKRNTTMPTRVGTHTWHYSGLAAYDVLANELLNDKRFPNDDKVLSAAIELFMFDGIFLLLEERQNAAAFLSQMASGGLPGTGLIQHAADLYSEEAAILRSSTEYISFQPHTQLDVIADRSVRRELCNIVREAKIKEECAISQLELVYKVLTNC
ncbi:RNA polymerase sigma factor [bacterium]|nr:RNA polymerase sigma factor [bacterium]